MQNLILTFCPRTWWAVRTDNSSQKCVLLNKYYNGKDLFTKKNLTKHCSYLYNSNDMIDFLRRSVREWETRQSIRSLENILDLLMWFKKTIWNSRTTMYVPEPSRTKSLKHFLLIKNIICVAVFSFLGTEQNYWNRRLILLFIQAVDSYTP